MRIILYIDNFYYKQPCHDFVFSSSNSTAALSKPTFIEICLKLQTIGPTGRIHVPLTFNCLSGCGEMFSLIYCIVQRPVWYHWHMFLVSSVGTAAFDFYPNIKGKKYWDSEHKDKNLDTIIDNWVLLNTGVFQHLTLSISEVSGE